MSFNRCDICGLHQEKLLAKCVDCGRHFCNYKGNNLMSHVIQHIADTRHVHFEFPRYGAIKCQVCCKRNVCVLNEDIESKFYCNKHVTESAAPLIQNNSIHYVLPQPSKELMDSIMNLKSKQNQQFEQSNIDKQIAILIAEQVNDLTEKIKSIENSLMEIPISFPVKGRDVKFNKNKSIVQHCFPNELESGRIILVNNEYYTEDLSLEHEITLKQQQVFDYAAFMKSALIAENLKRQSDAELTKEALSSSAVYFRTKDGQNYEAFFLWNRKRLNGQLVNPGDTIQLEVICTDKIVQLVGTVRANSDYLLVRLDDKPPEECVQIMLHDMNEIVLDNKIQLSVQATTIQIPYFNDYNVFRGSDGISYLIKLCIDQANLERMIMAVNVVSKNKDEIQNYDIIKGSFAADSIGEALKDASIGLAGKEKTENIIEDLKKYLVQCNATQPNESQLTAVERALQNSVSLIQGCFGGGKTFTSALIMKCFTKLYPNKKILCATGSNIAADNLLIAARAIKLNAVRVYALSREDSEMRNTIKVVKDYSLHMIIYKNVENYYYVTMNVIEEDVNNKIYQQFIENIPIGKKSGPEIYKAYQELQDYELSRADIIITTCMAAASKVITNEDYGACIIDETSETIEPETLIPILCAPNHFVLIGDQKQLGPTIANKVVSRMGFSRSIYSRLLALKIKPVMLNMQYRMHPGLLQLPNISFYYGTITSAITADQRTLKRKSNQPNGIERLFTDEFPSFLWHCQSIEKQNLITKSYSNDKEAEVVEQIVNQLLSEYGLRENEIGVITPYSAQQELIQETLLSHYDIEVNSVDGFQGREKDIIIFSCVRSNLDGKIGFLYERRRVNVALTRAKYAVIIVGDVSCLQNGIWANIVDFYMNKHAIYYGDDLRSLKVVKKLEEIMPKQPEGIDLYGQTLSDSDEFPGAF